MKMRFLPDEPITDISRDQLGLSDFVKLIQSSIYNTMTPFVYGVLGDWGSGKTTILRLLEKRLQEDLSNRTHYYVPIWFDAWKYENETNIIYPLLHAIKRSYGSRFDKQIQQVEGFGQRFLMHFVQVVSTSAYVLGDVGLRAATKYLSGEAIGVKDLKDALEFSQERIAQKHDEELTAALGQWADRVSHLEGAFEALLDAYASNLSEALYVRGDRVRFVIIIDDLDRCLPDTTIAVLESIKNYLSVKNCVFVLGLNPKVIYQAIRIKYEGLEIEGQEYLEKILNYSFYVPEPSLERVAEFATSQLEDLVVHEKTRKQYRELFVCFGRVLKGCHFNNPRKIKRILNRYLLFMGKFQESIDEHRGDDFYNDGVVRLIIIAEYYPDIFQLFLRDRQGDLDLLQKLADVHAGRIDVEYFDEKGATSITSRYFHFLHRRGLFDFTDLGRDTFDLARDVYSITRVS